ncbi:MAG: CPBP family intramembrane metalloprotease [Patescibacteria group bacterium]|nr:CPBP family intramembrane metalloprotease [Patescibacteria group bacterium]
MHLFDTIISAIVAYRLAIIFWASVALSVTCILKTDRKKQPNLWDALFLLCSWELFNTGFWQSYLADTIGIANGYVVSATLCVLLAHWYGIRRNIPLWLFITLEKTKDAFAWIAALLIILVPLGFLIHFLKFSPHLDTKYVCETISGYLLVATVEETYFRGIILNLCRRVMHDKAALAVTTVLFATIYTHITGGGHFPNWSYVGMALIAGLAYGLSFLEANTLAVPILVHASVDSIWRILLT